ncbi:MAG: hypothetical protein JO053_14385 [Acidobacteria bacterium]|nr:hypothetical protein [Acidobacteriota bacterium]
MSEWLAANWVTIVLLAASGGLHWGIATQKWQSLRDEFHEFKDAILVRLTKAESKFEEGMAEMEDKIDEVQRSFSIHTANSEIHVSPTLLELFKERHDFNKQQFTEMRNDVQRIEALLSKP